MMPRSGCAFGSALLWLWVAAGCAVNSAIPDAPRDDALDQCADLFAEVDAAVHRAGVRDAQAAPVPGFPYLRLNRFLAALEVQPEGATFESWIDHLRALDRDARAFELANLPADARVPTWAAALESCAVRLRRHDLANVEARNRLAAAMVPDDYSLALRTFGLYPLTSMPFLLGVRKLHRETARTFATALDDLPVHGTLRRFAPARVSGLDVAGVLARAAHNPPGIPEPEPADLARLFAAFAPVWELDVTSPADLPGRPALTPDGGARVHGEPTVYTVASHTFWQGRSLLQLNYVMWFPERPRRGRFDLVGGHLDGLTLRITLGMDGQPLLYESMHNCGCYYKAFPSPRLDPGLLRQGWQEPMLVPQRVDDGAGRLVVRLSAGDHYVQRLYRDPADAQDTVRYGLASYDELRSLPLPDGGRRSLFGPAGIVAGTERAERWLFWPMGVAEPGAMRQWGHHAIAFVGRRHFDDPRLLERHFVRRQDAQ